MGERERERERSGGRVVDVYMSGWMIKFLFEKSSWLTAIYHFYIFLLSSHYKRMDKVKH